MASDSTTKTVYTAPGLPPLHYGSKTLSFFEFWPTWLIYLPVALQWLVFALRYRSLTLPMLANPALPLAGMVGVPKSVLLAQAEGRCKKAILPWVVHHIDDTAVAAQARKLGEALAQAGLRLPLVCKPDIGCRGSGVKLIRSERELQDYLSAYPRGAGIMVQQLASWEPEAGVFFVKEPGHPQGKIISLALKYSPYVVGDGQSTLEELIKADPRARELHHLYVERHCEQLQKIIAQGEPYKLVFSASHCRGAVFRDARELITPALCQVIDSMMRDLPEFYYGRLDIKFKDVESLMRGETLEIVEINAVSSESLHIWDSQTPYFQAMRDLLAQYRLLFRLGHFHRQRGHRAPGLKRFIKHWKIERHLHRYYPPTD